MKILIRILFFLCFIRVLDAKEMVTIQQNVNHKLRQLGLPTDVVEVFAIGKKGDRLYALPNLVNGKDRLWDDIHDRKKLWRKDCVVWTKLSHGDGESWRTPKNASLQVTVHHFQDSRRYYEIDLDNWAPRGVRTPINSVRHIVWEVWRNKLGFVTSQNRIEHTLNKADIKADVRSAQRIAKLETKKGRP
jgi:hypothetical protein